MSIYNLVRALSEPYLGAHFIYHDQKVKVWECRIENFQVQNLEPGKVVDSGNETALIKTGDGAVRILRYDPLIILKKGEYL
jgi:methionyl-tRNA formyltransferase